jgi:uncharacterized HhH-GPD family protein
VQELCRVIADEHNGDATRLWSEATDGAELLKTIKSLPGFGEQKARIFVALLGKQLGVRPSGWEKAAGIYGEKGSFRSVADIEGPDSLGRVRAYKQEMKAQAKAVAKEKAAPDQDGAARGKGSASKTKAVKSPASGRVGSRSR